MSPEPGDRFSASPRPAFGAMTALGRECGVRHPASRRMLERSALVLLAAAVAWCGWGCAPRTSREQIEASRRERAQRLVESGNEAYKLGDYRLAARRYAAAAVVKKDDPAAYFGMGMALSKLGRDEEARAAYARSRELSRRQAVLQWPGSRPRRGGEPETVRASRGP